MILDKLLVPGYFSPLSRNTDEYFMAVPKRKHSRARRNKRRAHDRLRLPDFARCGRCEQPVPAHTVCPHCGFYSGRIKAVVAEKELA